MKEEGSEGRYYGIAWNRSTNTYRRTGVLTEVSDYESVEDTMFIHNSIKKRPDGMFKCKRVYYQHKTVGDEEIVNISDMPLLGFKPHPTASLVMFLMRIEYGIFKSFEQSVK